QADGFSSNEVSDGVRRRLLAAPFSDAPAAPFQRLALAYAAVDAAGVMWSDSRRYVTVARIQNPSGIASTQPLWHAAPHHAARRPVRVRANQHRHLQENQTLRRPHHLV